MSTASLVLYPERRQFFTTEKITWMGGAQEDGEDNDVYDGDKHPVFEFEIFEGRGSRLQHQPCAENLRGAEKW